MRLHVEIERAVPGEELQHVIEKADARRDRVAPASLQDQLQPDLRFRRPAIDQRAPHR